MDPSPGRILESRVVENAIPVLDSHDAVARDGHKGRNCGEAGKQKRDKQDHDASSATQRLIKPAEPIPVGESQFHPPTSRRSRSSPSAGPLRIFSR